MIMLDTDIMIDILCQYEPAVKWLSKEGYEKIVLSGFVLMELLQGCRNKKEQMQIENILIDYDIIWPTKDSCKNAYKNFSKYHLSHKIGIIDSLIGQSAIDLQIPLYTFNGKHYECIPLLKTIKPYKKNN